LGYNNFDDEIEEDEFILSILDDDDEQTCKDQFNDCMAKASGIFAKVKCALARVKCNTPNVFNCVKKCGAARKDCLSKANGLKEKAMCMKENAKCAFACRKAISDETVETPVFADGTADENPTCKDAYTKCMAAAKGTTDKMLCIKDRIVCHSKNIGQCLAECGALGKKCFQETSGLDKLKCIGTTGRCTVECRNSLGYSEDMSEVDEIELLEAMDLDDSLELELTFNDDAELEDEPATCKDKYEECKAKADGIIAKGKCLMERARCNKPAVTKCLADCRASRRKCYGETSGFLEKAKCALKSIQCGFNCRKSTSYDGFIDDAPSE